MSAPATLLLITLLGLILVLACWLIPTPWLDKLTDWLGR